MPTDLEDHVGREGVTSGFRLRMKEVFLFIRQKDALLRPRSCIGGTNEIRRDPSYAQAKIHLDKAFCGTSNETKSYSDIIWKPYKQKLGGFANR